MANMDPHKRIAVMDLGTNVFNLSIADLFPKGYKFIKEFKYAAKLGAGGGIKTGRILPVAFESAERALSELMRVVDETGEVSLIHPYATSAVRDAENSVEFVTAMNKKFGINIDVIPGEREAELIFKGIKASGVFDNLKEGENAMLMDIGGGSNEFIITDGCSVLYKRSFPLGMARMREKFNYTEPIGKEVAEEFAGYCHTQLNELWQMTQRYKPAILVGSSGSFDTFKDYIYNCGLKGKPYVELPLDRLAEMNSVMAKSVAAERMKMPGMSPVRVDFIVLSSLFTQLVIKEVNPKMVYQSAYSLKEGAVSELYEEWKEMSGGNSGDADNLL